MKLQALKIADLPDPPKLSKLIGPSFILLGMGLGSGEIILWPYLTSNFGMGIIWASIFGITLQFFLNMEISRYTLATGESVFVGLARKLGVLAPIWFLLSTYLPWMWPGIIASSGTVFAKAINIPYNKYFGILMLITIGIILSLGKVVYKTQEKFQKYLIIIGIPFVFILTFILAKPSGYADLTTGLFGIGNNYFLFPKGLPFAIFLGALAYAGAGGNLNLAQSLYIKEKGYGMGKYSGKISSLIAGTNTGYELEGTTFIPTPENNKRFNLWWKRINLEHLMVFWATGALTMLMLSLLSYSTVFGKEDLSQGINFVIQEGLYIIQKTSHIIGVAFFLIVSLMLYGTQFSVFGTTSRIMSENLPILSKKRFNPNNISKYFYSFLWLQILGGVVIFSLGYTEPLQLVVIGAVLNAITMFIYSGLILWLNTTLLNTAQKPSLLRMSMILLSFVFYGGFSLFTIIQKFS